MNKPAFVRGRCPICPWTTMWMRTEEPTSGLRIRLLQQAHHEAHQHDTAAVLAEAETLCRQAVQ